MTVGIIASILWVVSVVGYIIWNLFQKNKRLESMIISQQIFINGMKECMKEVNITANQIDSQIWVQSDPEFLSLMENVKIMQSKINEFIEL